MFVDVTPYGPLARCYGHSVTSVGPSMTPYGHSARCYGHSVTSVCKDKR